MRNSHPLFKEMIEQARQAPTREARTKILEQYRSKAIADFPVQLKLLEELLLKYSPVAVLALFGFYDLSYLPDVGRRFNEGDPIEQYHIELIQALVLCRDIDAVWKTVESDVARAVIVAIPIRSEMAQHRHTIIDKMAEDAMGKASANLAVVIVVDVDAQHWPYSGIYVLDNSPTKLPT